MVWSSRFLSSSEYSSTQVSYKQFFIRLSFGLDGPPNVLSPAQGYGNFDRNYLRMYIYNKGHAIANDCVAELTVLRTGDLKQLCWDGIPLLTDLSNKRKIGVNSKEILHIVFSDSRSTKNYGYISTMQSIANPSIIRLEDAYNHKDFDVDVMVRTEGGSYCKTRLRIYPDNNFNNIKMEMLWQDSGHLKLKESKEKLKHVFSNIKS
jgi:hypothetical protein